MPLKSPRSCSSRVMVASAWNVERYWTFGAGFWKRYFTVGVAHARDHPLLQLFPFSVGAVREGLTRVEWESHDYTRDACDGASEKIQCGIKFDCEASRDTRVSVER